MRWLSPLLVAMATALGAAACSQAPRRDCVARVWVPRAAGDVHIVGSWDGWQRPGAEPDDYDGDWRLLRLELPPGEHGYLLEADGALRVDPHNPLTTWDGDREVSALDVADCSEPRLAVEHVEVVDERLRIEARFLASETGSALDPASIVASSGSGALEVVESDRSTGRVVLASGVGPGKHRVTLEAKDDDGRSARAEAVAWSEPRAETPSDALIYQVMIDRFRGDGGVSLPAPATPGSRAGGTLGGVQHALPELTELGVTTLWLSPVYATPHEPRLGRDGRLYEGYHGYWPEQSRVVEERIGGETAMRSLIDDAHGRGMGVLLDVVPNHVYETNPRFDEGAAAGWFTEPGCVCGTPECSWSEHIVDCWFTPYLPDYRWQIPAARHAAIDDVLFWTEGFDLDGVRVDAVPMMPRAASRWLAYEIRRRVEPRSANFLLGEVFTGRGTSGLAQLKYHLGRAGLDSVFDFPLMWALHDAIATSKAGFDTVETLLQDEEVALAGSGAVLARMIDNHDTPRFISVASGDAGGDPWDEPATQPGELAPYQRLEMALATLLTLPGVPVLYQGDEIGLAGGGDPDNRRVMPADEELLDAQLELRGRVARLGRLRACSETLRRGDRHALFADSRRYAYLRGIETSEPVAVAMSTATVTTTVALSLPPGIYVDALSGAPFDASEGTLALELAPLSYRVLLREGDPCLP